MKRRSKFFLIFLFIILMIVSCFFNAFASDKMEVSNDSWVFCVYQVDNGNVADYNRNILIEMKSVDFSDNIQIISASSRRETFSSFIEKCKKETVANHKVLIIVGEGEGVYGIRKVGNDHFALKEIVEGFEKTCLSNVNNPEFDLTYFDASLMCFLEMGKILNGYSKYLLAAESLLYETKDFYKNWFKEFVKNTNISPMDLGKLIIDEYKKIIDTEHSKNEKIISTNLSLIDVKQLNKSYNDYLKFVKNFVKIIGIDNLVLAYVSREARTTVTAGDAIDEKFDFNMIDCMDFMHNTKKYFPIMCGKVMKSLEKSILYKINLGFTDNLFGISIYFPKRGFEGHNELMKNYFEVIKDEFIEGLYIYKMTGNVSNEFNDILKKNGIGKIKNIDYNVCSEFVDMEPKLNNKLKFTYNFSKVLKSLGQYCYINVFKRNEDKFCRYNEDTYFEFDKNNNIKNLFEGKWDKFDDVPLHFNLLSETKNYEKFWTNIKYNGEEKKLYGIYEYAIDGSKTVGLIDETQPTRLVGNVVKCIKDGDNIDLYNDVCNIFTAKESFEIATSFVYNNNYRIENKMLEDGEYTCAIIFENLAGNRFQGGNILFNIENGKIKDVFTEKEIKEKIAKQ